MGPMASRLIWHIPIYERLLLKGLCVCRRSVGRWAARLLLRSYLVIVDIQGYSRPRVTFSYFCTFHGLPLVSDEILISLHVGFTVMWTSGAT